METKDLVFKIVVSLVYGIFLGAVSLPIAKKLALSRTEDPADAAPLNKTWVKVLSIVLGLASSFGLTFTASAGEADLYIRNLLLLIPIFVLSFVDAVVRKIPNSCLLAALLIEAVYAVYHCVTDKEEGTRIIPAMFIGFFLGMIVCILPSILKIPMGAGDIKYNAVIGICLYATGYFQSMMFMAILVAIYYIYLKITKKGGMKTMAPMGPFLSAGTVITMCFSVLELFGIHVNF